MSQTVEARAETAGRLTKSVQPVVQVDLAATESSGEWVPPDQLREAALATLAMDGNVRVSLAAVNHLDTSALQVLLALAAELKTRNRTLELANVSPALERWFGYAGATALLAGVAQQSERTEVAQR